MKFKLEIETGNAALADDLVGGVIDILHQVADKLCLVDED